jgi:protein farnesyltransferase/geranylgeranyltransferase type-1 subunit alpha
MLQDGSEEQAFTAHILELDEDSKNYHAWAHRQWAIKTFGLWEPELAFVEGKLSEDFRNNSAWNYRFFVVSSTTGMDQETRLREISFALGWIRKAPNNQSPWNYIQG